jgi:hypothetical protein
VKTQYEKAPAKMHDPLGLCQRPTAANRQFSIFDDFGIGRNRMPWSGQRDTVTPPRATDA